jgi:L-arabinonolactonase
MLRIELLIDAKAELGEGPLWDVEEERLYWIDSLAPAIHVCDANGGSRRSWALPEPIGSLASRPAWCRASSSPTRASRASA